jgi:hypothetical protein
MNVHANLSPTRNHRHHRAVHEAGRAGALALIDRAASRVAVSLLLALSASCALVALTGCGETPSARSPNGQSSDAAITAGEQRCFDGITPSSVVVCRAEARMRAARRDGNAQLFECYDDKVQQMHVQQRIAARADGQPGTGTHAASSVGATDTPDRKARTELRIGELWAQLGDCSSPSRAAALATAAR